jgi:surfeit locus 1 family protein
MLSAARRERFVIALGALLMVALTARLGWWQLDRAAQKRAIVEAREQRAKLPPLDGVQWATTPSAAAEQHHRRVRLVGHWRPKHTVYLENRQMGARPGFFVITPLVLADSSAVLVQRGWLPRDPNERTRVPAVPSADGEVELVGLIAPPPARLYEFSAAASGPIRQNIDLDAFARETGLSLRPLSVLQADSPAFAADGLGRDWPVPAAGIQTHYGYAFQWFGLCALIAGLYVWFQLLRPRPQQR